MELGKQIANIRKLIRTHQMPEAAAEIETLAKHQPTEPIIQAMKGLYLAETGQYQEALGYFAHALDKLPRDSALLFNIAVVSNKLGYFAAAEEAIQRAIHLGPQNPTAYYELARINTNQKDHNAAVMALFKSVQTDPQFLPAYLALGIYLELDNQKNLAIKLYEAGLSSNPNNQFIMDRLAELRAL